MKVREFFRFLGGGGMVEPTLEFSALIIAIYCLAGVFSALAYFHYADVSRRVS